MVLIDELLFRLCPGSSTITLPANGWPATGAIVAVGVAVGVGFATAVPDVEGLGATRTAGAIGLGDDTMVGVSGGADDAGADAGANGEAGEATGETGAGAKPDADDAVAAELDSPGPDSMAASWVALVHAASVTSAATAITRRARTARGPTALSVGRGMLHADTRSHAAPARCRSAGAHVGSGSEHDPIEEDAHGTGCAV